MIEVRIKRKDIAKLSRYFKILLCFACLTKGCAFDVIAYSKLRIEKRSAEEVSSFT